MTKDVQAYLVTALWASVDDDGTPFDANYGTEAFAPDALATAAEDIERFRILAGEHYALAQEYTGYDDARFMCDLWLTQNRHGAGFWDGYYGHYGDALTRAAELVGERVIYLGDDNALHLY